MPGPQDPRMMMQAFSQLMQDPVAMKAMMQGAQQMGIDPQMLQQLAGGGGGGPGGPQMPMSPPEGGGQPMPPEAEVSGEGSEGMPMDAEQMATDQIDNAGATFDGVDAPTQNDIDRLMAEPTDSMVEAFDAQFGDGAAAQYLGQQGGGDGSEPADEPEGSGPPEATEAEEY